MLRSSQPLTSSVCDKSNSMQLYSARLPIKQACGPRLGVRCMAAHCHVIFSALYCSEIHAKIFDTLRETICASFLHWTFEHTLFPTVNMARPLKSVERYHCYFLVSPSPNDAPKGIILDDKVMSLLTMRCNDLTKPAIFRATSCGAIST